MKKYLLVVLLFLAVTLVACDELTITPQEKPSVEEQIDKETTDEKSTEEESIDAGNSLEEVLSLLQAYCNKLQEISGFEGEFGQEMESYNTTFLSYNGAVYNRDEFTEYDNRENLHNGGFDPEMAMNTIMTLKKFQGALKGCDNFVEGKFCDVDYYSDYNSTLSKLKVEMENYKLYFESYTYRDEIINNQNYLIIAAELFSIDLIDGLIQVDYVRDNIETINESTRHDVYYDFYKQNEETINIAIKNEGVQEIYFQRYTAIDDKVLLYSFSEEGVAFNIRDIEKDIFYSISTDSEFNLEYMTVVFYEGNNKLMTHRESFTQDKYKTLTWNLLEVSGWDTVEIEYNNIGHLFIGETEILENFDIRAYFEHRQSVDGTRDIEYVLINQERFDLSEYGLMFDAVSFEDYQAALEKATINYIDFLADNNISTNREDNLITFNAMIPFLADQDIVDEFYRIK